MSLNNIAGIGGAAPVVVTPSPEAVAGGGGGGEETLAFTLIGLILFAIAFWIIVKVSPFSIRKELEDDQNIALGIVIASVIIGIALIVSAAIHG